MDVRAVVRDLAAAGHAAGGIVAEALVLDEAEDRRATDRTSVATRGSPASKPSRAPGGFICRDCQIPAQHARARSPYANASRTNDGSAPPGACARAARRAADRSSALSTRGGGTKSWRETAHAMRDLEPRLVQQREQRLLRVPANFSAASRCRISSAISGGRAACSSLRMSAAVIAYGTFETTWYGVDGSRERRGSRRGRHRRARWPANRRAKPVVQASLSRWR